MTHSTAPTNESNHWCSALRDRYRFALPADLEDWFSREVWLKDRGGEFDQPVSPTELLSESPDFIWPGFMLPDSLPLLGNRYGDWLCLRIGPDNSASEVIHWYHGGGDWMPWGETLAEAVAFDNLRRRLPGRRQYYANVAAEFDQHLGADTIPGWAAKHLPEPVARLLLDPPEAPIELDGLADLLIDHGVAQTAVHGECALAALDSLLRQKLEPWVARELGIHWDQDAIRWLFDNDLTPPSVLDRLAKEFQCDSDELCGQDWDTAVVHASAVAAKRGDLGWANDILGWSEERAGRPEAAITAYLQALHCSSFADQSVRFRTHWYRESEGKFAAARLQDLHAHWNAEVQHDPYLRLFRESKDQGLRSRVTNHWMRIGERAASDGRWADAYDGYYRAGWDMGCDDLHVYEDLLSKLAEAAERSGQVSRAELARTHLACLINRLR
ncbi:hypothetical protein EC9_13200 [Rosistilla ulvae]|uniref:Uncharacterized protein n=1 Tax=Rosistilla ulvae TaxID=1930277 RepID=A0A517LWZ1_9BACT|nr:SMI1/KNR4 family protein [Rosistilla ulvae]QDS87144.1 hypothetical protein EC9_13200 [Rosistilla ulvae]